jgi:hypothetical protein
MAKPSTGNLPVPAALTRGVTLQVIDYNEVELILTAGSDGIAQDETDQLQQNQYMRIERIVVTTSSQNTVEVTIYQGDNPIPQRGRDWTILPPGYVAVSEYPSFLTILPTYCLMAQVTGANEGDTFCVVATYQLVQKLTNR